jgi:hypothetical protein
MAQAKARSSSKGKSSSQGQRKSTSARSSRGSSASSKTKARSTRAKSNRSKGRSNGAATALAGLGTVVGLVGGVVLGSKFARKPKRVLGVKVPGTGAGVDGLAKQIGKAGKEFTRASRQLGQLTDEVRSAKQKAEQVGKAIS